MPARLDVRADDHRGGALRALLALVLCAPCFSSFACARVERPPVAPFGGDLAAPLPARDVIGLVRFLPGDDLVAPLLEVLGKGDGDERRFLSVAAPAATVLGLLEQTRFAAADEPFAIVLLDASVHGAIAGFAWRGDGAAFRKAARERGLVLPDDDRVELPGRGRIEGFEVLSDVMRLRGSDVQPLPHVDYHLVERDGVTLLLPARDGVRNVLAALESTRALDPLVGDFCSRFELGPAVDEVRDVARQMALMQVNHLIDRWMGSPLERGDGREVRVESGRSHAWHDQRRMQNTVRRVVDGMLDFGESIEHLFVHVDDDRAEVYLRATEDGFFRRLLPLARNVPIAELLAGAPSDAELVVAASCDPKLLVGVESIWEESRQGFFRREQRPRFRDADDVDEMEPEPAFIDSFGGRIWVALAREESDLGISARVFAQLVNDETNLGATAALAKLSLPSSWFESVQAASIAVYSVSRVEGGCIEVIGGSPHALVTAERRRLEGARPLLLPDDLLPEAFLCLLGTIPGRDAAAAVTAARDGDGIRVRFSLPRR